MFFFSFFFLLLSWLGVHFGKLVTRVTCTRLSPCRRLVSRIFWGSFRFTPFQKTSGSSVVNVLVHVIVKWPCQRRLYSASGVFQLKKVSYLADDAQRLWTHLYNKKGCHCEGQYVAPGNLRAAPGHIFTEKHTCLVRLNDKHRRQNRKQTFNFDAADAPIFHNFLLLAACLWGEVTNSHLNSSSTLFWVEH